MFGSNKNKVCKLEEKICELQCKNKEKERDITRYKEDVKNKNEMIFDFSQRLEGFLRENGVMAYGEHCVYNYELDYLLDRLEYSFTPTRTCKYAYLDYENNVKKGTLEEIIKRLQEVEKDFYDSEFKRTLLKKEIRENKNANVECLMSQIAQLKNENYELRRNNSTKINHAGDGMKILRLKTIYNEIIYVNVEKISFVTQEEECVVRMDSGYNIYVQQSAEDVLAMIVDLEEDTKMVINE